MEITITRRPSLDSATIGRLCVDGGWSCYTLEDQVRERDSVSVNAWKIPGETAIPRGRYQVVISMSEHFGRLMPLLLNVPGFIGIRIHPGNKPADTEGCILVGLVALDSTTIARSREAFATLYDHILGAINKGEKVWLTIE